MFIVGSDQKGKRSGDRYDVGYALDSPVADALQNGVGYGGTN